MSQSYTPAESVDTSSLFDEFPRVSRAEWEEQIRKDLKLDAADYEKKMVWRSPEGFAVQPFYDREDLRQIPFLNTQPGAAPYLRGNRKNSNAWEIREEILDVPVDQANRRALQALKAGVDSVTFAVGVTGGELIGADLSGDVRTAFRQLLNGIWLDAASVHFRCGAAAPVVLALWLAEIERQQLDPAQIGGSVDYDPLSDLLRDGALNLARAFDVAAVMLRSGRERLPRYRVLTISDSVYHNAGAGLVQELAFALAAGNEYLARLSDLGFGVDEIAPALQFDFSISSSYFMEIARLRAARLLWSRIVQEYGPREAGSCSIHIHGRTSSWNQTIYDPYVNMLRATTEAMSAAIGACDSFTVLPFDLPIRAANSDDFGARMARNTQAVLKHEAHLDKVVDPAAGSYFLENLTDRLARDAWSLFQEVEAAGGFVAAARSGLIQARVAATGSDRQARIASRKSILLGTNQYPNAPERMRAARENGVPRPLPSAGAPVALPPGGAGSAASDWLRGLEQVAVERGFAQAVADLSGAFDVQASALKARRAATDFEELRLATEDYVAQGHPTPRVFLLAFGDLAMRKARSMFAANFFACAGYEILDNPGFSSAGDGARAAAQAGAQIVVFCGADEEYPAQVPSAVVLLGQAAEPPRIVIAGYPAEHLDALRAAGVQHFIHARSNVLEELRAFQSALGIAAQS